MLKNQKASFYAAAAAALCALAGFILLVVSNRTMGYPIQDFGLAAFLTIAGIVTCGLSMFAQAKKSNELIVSFLRLAALGCIMGAFAITLADRAVVAGGLFTWNSLDSFAWTAFYTGIACGVFQLLSVAAVVVSGCMKQA